MADTADVPVFHGDVYLQRYNSALVVTISEAEEQIEKALAAYDPSHLAAKKGAAKTGPTHTIHPEGAAQIALERVGTAQRRADTPSRGRRARVEQGRCCVGLGRRGRRDQPGQRVAERGSGALELTLLERFRPHEIEAETGVDIGAPIGKRLRRQDR